jgi:hypothetical protein
MASRKAYGHGTGRGRGRKAVTSGRGGRGNVYGSSQSQQGKNFKTGLCKELEGNIFDFGSKTVPDQM